MHAGLLLLGCQPGQGSLMHAGILSLGAEQPVNLGELCCRQAHCCLLGQMLRCLQVHWCWARDRPAWVAASPQMPA